LARRARSQQEPPSFFPVGLLIPAPRGLSKNKRFEIMDPSAFETGPEGPELEG